MLFRFSLGISFFIALVGGSAGLAASGGGDKLSEKIAARIEKQLQGSSFKKGEIGVWVSDGQTTVFERNSSTGFIPASLSKIPTAAAVLNLLPPGHKFVTRFAATRGSSGAGITAQGKVKGGVLKGPLYLIGGGDPSFVSENMWFLVNELMRSGITEVEGDLIVDDSRFDGIRFGDDRQSQRVDRAYDAPIGAMSLNWNSVTAWVRPGSGLGDIADVTLDVMSPFLRLQNKTKTTSAGKGNAIAVERLGEKADTHGETFLAGGSIALDQPEKAIYKSVRDPDFWSGQSATVFLAQRGIKIKGSVKTGRAPADAVTLAKADSKSIASIVADMMKWSNNYVAEMLVKNLAAESGEQPATMKTGVARVRSFLEKTVGLKPDQYEFINAAGFTRENKMSPAQLGAVLSSVRKDFRIFPEFLTALPVAGVDGTLRNRFKDKEGVGWVRAKTGLLNGAIGLAGFAGDDAGRLYTFVFLFNGAAGNEEKARHFFDQLAASLVGAT